MGWLEDIGEFEGPAGVQSGTATPVQMGGGSGSGGWQQWLQRFGGGGGGGMRNDDQLPDQGGSFSRFNEAFQYGYDPESYIRRKNQERQFRLQEQEALRRQEEHAYNMDQRRAAAARQAAIARQIAALEATQTGVSQPAQAQYAQLGYTPEQVATGAGLRGAAGFRDQVARYQNDVDSSDLQSVPEGTVRYNATGLPAPRVNANNISTAGPSEADIYGQLGRVALASGDMKGFVESRGMAKDSRFDEAYLAGRDTVMGMDDKTLTAELNNMKKSGELPGFGSFGYDIDPKTGKKSAYMTYKTTGGNELRLDRDELADLAGFREAMRVDPMRARKELSKLKGDSRTMAFELFKAQAEGAKVNNNVQEARERSALGWVRLAQDREEFSFRRDAARNDIKGAATQYRMGPDGALVPYITGVRTGTGGALESVALEIPGGSGLIPASVLDPTSYYKTAESMVGTPVMDPTTGRPVIGRDRQPIVHTMGTAVEHLRNQAIRGYVGGRGTGQPVTSQEAANTAAALAAGGRAGASSSAAPAASQSSAPAFGIDRFYTPRPRSPDSWLGNRPAAAAPAGRGDSIIELMQQRQEGLPPGVKASGLGYIVNGRAYFNRDEAIRAAGY